jgi:alpha-glucosidase
MTTPTWWRNAIAYQIYPRSFADSNGDGIGDLRGIIEKLDYLQSIGITALWISPFYPSPNFDWGYDVADYMDVDPDYGTLEEADLLIKEAHQRGIRIILDLVLNHTSDQHHWFQESKSCRENSYRDWYIWEDGVNGGPPNDWEAIFGGSAWQYDESTGQYYYHFFFPEQPELNWRNPAVEIAMFDAIRFWLDRGVDGFRIDALPCIYETEDFPNCDVAEPLNEMFLKARQGMFEAGGFESYNKKLRHQLNHPDVHPLMERLRQVIDEYNDHILLGEVSEVEYYGDGVNEIHSVFNFPLITKLEAPLLRQILLERLPTIPIGAWECNTVGNHDRTRSYTLYSDGSDDEARARMALAMVMFLRGTPMIYYGEEIGMRNGAVPAIEDFRDGLGTWFYHSLRRKGQTHAEALKITADFFCRDRCRTPMQWDNTPNGGFSPAEVDTWLPVNTDFGKGINVAEQERSPDSTLSFFKKIVQVRRENEALGNGEITLIPGTGDVLAFCRHNPEQHLLVALNMSAQVSKLHLTASNFRLIYTNAQHPALSENDQLRLQPYQIFVGESLDEEADY